METVEILIPISFFAAVFGIVYVIITARNRERLTMIEKGVDMSIFYVNKKQISKERVLNNLKYGIILLSISGGLLFGNILRYNTQLINDPPVAYFSMIFLFAGTGLILFYFIMRKHQNDSEEA